MAVTARQDSQRAVRREVQSEDERTNAALAASFVELAWSLAISLNNNNGIIK